MGSLKSRLASLGKKETIIASLLIASLGLTVGFSMMQEPEYQTIDEKVSPIGEQINSTDQYRFSEYKGNMLFGPYLVDDKRYFYYEGEVVNQNLKSVNRPQVEGLHNFYMKTYTDPLFYSPAAEDQQMNLSGFKRFEQDKILTRGCGLDYEVIPQQYLNELSQNYKSTNQFYRYASVENAQDLVEQNRQTVNGYSGMVSQFLEVMDKNISQNRCFRDDVRDGGIAKATLTPVQYRIDTKVFLNYSRMANENAELALQQIDSREQILAGEKSLGFGIDSPTNVRNFSYDFNLMYTGEEAKKEFNRRMVSEYTSLGEDEGEGSEYIPGSSDQGSAAEESESEEEEESEGSIEDMNISEQKALEIAKSELDDKWEFKNSTFAEGALRHLFEADNARAIIEVTPNGLISEKIYQRGTIEGGKVDINYTEALSTARTALNDSWELNQRGELVSGVYKFGFSNGPLNAEITVSGAEKRILLDERELISEAVVEGGEPAEEGEEGYSEESELEGEAAEKARSVDEVPNRYYLNSQCLGGDTTPVYGWNKNIYPNMISGQKLIEKSEEDANLRDFFTTCRCPYVDVARLDWYVVDDQFKSISSNPVSAKYNASMREEVEQAEQIFLQSPGDDSMSQLSEVYGLAVKQNLKEGNYDSRIPEMWRRNTQQSSKLYKFKTAYDDFFNEKHMEVWSKYFPYGDKNEEKFERRIYNYFLVTESQYPLKFMTYSDSVWRLEERPDSFSGRVGTSGIGLNSNSLPE